VHIVTAQVSHPPPMSEQISSDEHTGHGGGLGGQLAHLRKRVGLVKSASIGAVLVSLADSMAAIDLPNGP